MYVPIALLMLAYLDMKLVRVCQAEINVLEKKRPLLWHVKIIVLGFFLFGLQAIANHNALMLKQEAVRGQS